MDEAIFMVVYLLLRRNPELINSALSYCCLMYNNSFDKKYLEIIWFLASNNNLIGTEYKMLDNLISLIPSWRMYLNWNIAHRYASLIHPWSAHTNLLSISIFSPRLLRRIFSNLKLAPLTAANTMQCRDVQGRMSEQAAPVPVTCGAVGGRQCRHCPCSQMDGWMRAHIPTLG